MRHRVKSVRLNRPSNQLKALVRSLVTSVILYESIETTKSKAKLAQAKVDRILSTAKRKVANNDQHNAIRYLKKTLLDVNASKKVMEELINRYNDRNSGFTRIVKTRVRQGDSAPMVQFQLV